MTLGLDGDLLERFLSGPYPSIVRAVTLVTGSHPAAQDAVHEAMARAWERRATIDRLEPWIVTTALNLARNRRRKLAREVAGATPPSPASSSDEARIEIEHALHRLPHRQREVIVLHYFLDLPVAEVARIIGLTEGGTKHALFRARQSLLPLLTLDTEPPTR